MSYDSVLQRPVRGSGKSTFGSKTGVVFGKGDKVGTLISKDTPIYGHSKSGKAGSKYDKATQGPTNTTYINESNDDGPEIVYVVKPKANKAKKDTKAGKISKNSKKKLGDSSSAIAQNSSGSHSLPRKKVSKSLKRSGSIDVDASNGDETLPPSVPTGSSVSLQTGTDNNTNDSAPAAENAPSQGAQFVGGHGQTSMAKSAKPIQTTAPIPTPSISLKPASSDHSKESKAAKREKEHLGSSVSSTSSSTSDTPNWAKGVAFSGYRTKSADFESSNVQTASSTASTSQQFRIPLLTLAILGFFIFS